VVLRREYPVNAAGEHRFPIQRQATRNFREPVPSHTSTCCHRRPGRGLEHLLGECIETETRHSGKRLGFGKGVEKL
jgi:hypothetical protein